MPSRDPVRRPDPLSGTHRAPAPCPEPWSNRPGCALPSGFTRPCRRRNDPSTHWYHQIGILPCGPATGAAPPGPSTHRIAPVRSRRHFLSCPSTTRPESATPAPARRPPISKQRSERRSSLTSILPKPNLSATSPATRSSVRHRRPYRNRSVSSRRCHPCSGRRTSALPMTGRSTSPGSETVLSSMSDSAETDISTTSPELIRKPSSVAGRSRSRSPFCHRTFAPHSSPSLGDRTAVRFLRLK